MARDDCQEAISVTEPAFFDYTAWAFDYSEELRNALRKAGASEYLLRFVDTVDRDTRQSVLMTLFRHHAHSGASAEETVPPHSENCKDAYRNGGGFFQKLWDGHLADAFCHADDNNRRLMAREFGEAEIVSVGLSNDGPFSDYEYIRNLISERMERV